MAGELGGWSVVDRLHQITVPSLIINGRFDASQDAVVVPFLWKMPNAKWVCLEETSHMPFWEERERYLQLVANFLNA
jgi:pimeloyl-ACP methyl ester carboxylesterase